MKEQTPLYYLPVNYAHEHGELDQYRASYEANVACKEAIEQAIASHYHDNRLDTACVDQVLEQFGYERMFYILAHTVQQKDWDGRFSRDNKAWAKTISVIPDPDGYGGSRNVYLIVNRSHPGLTDLFLTRARQTYMLEREKKSSVWECLNKGISQQVMAGKPKPHDTQER